MRSLDRPPRSKARSPITLALRLCGLLATLALAGCAPNILDPQGEVGRGDATILIDSVAIMLAIVVGTWFDWYGLAANVVLLFLYLPFCGIAYPNAAAIALAPFSKNVGSAAALLGFLQMGIGALSSTGVGLLRSSSTLPIYIVMGATALTGLVIVFASQNRARADEPTL